MTPDWARAVKDAWNAGPNADQRSEKLDKYWDWIENAKQYVNGTVGLQATDRSGANTVLLQIADGRVTSVKLVAADEAAHSLYILGGTTEQWQEVMNGLHVGKVIMYRKLLLVQGRVLVFFKSVYYWTESIACIQRISTTF